MTPLEAARQLRHVPLAQCPGCQARLLPMWKSDPGTPEGQPERHEPTCPWVAIGRIVAALEAAERAHEAWYGPPSRFEPGEIYVRMVALGESLKDAP